MNYYSTKTPSSLVDLKEAVIRSLPPDNGLYLPTEIRPLSKDFWKNWREYSFSELSYEIAHCLLGKGVPEEKLREIVSGAIQFDAPLITLTEKLRVLELFQGPTLAFKDFGARFMARLMGYLTREDDAMLTVLVATSGDTGGAVASAFHNVPGTQVVILYPQGKVSELQEKQLTTMGGNIYALEIDGTFDDCQRMVKAAFLDAQLTNDLNLTSANSINIARLIPQSFYYFHAARQLQEGQEVVFVVPSGNFGNLTAGLMAQRLGLKVHGFVAATNVNNIVPTYLEEGIYSPRPSTATLSNAMDVGDPSNFARMQALHEGSWESMRTGISGYHFNDEQTKEAILSVSNSYGYQVCPHTAIGMLAAEANDQGCAEAVQIVLGTAHPAKFLSTMEEVLGKGAVEIPERLARLKSLSKHAVKLAPTAEALKHWLKVELQ